MRRFLDEIGDDGDEMYTDGWNVESLSACDYNETIL
jgi:hypothetical protein